MIFMKYLGVTKMKYLALFMLSGAVYADDTKEEPKVVYKQKTEIDFEGVDVVGELVRPQGSLILDRNRAKFNSMVWIRSDFDDEMDDMNDFLADEEGADTGDLFDEDGDGWHAAEDYRAALEEAYGDYDNPVIDQFQD